MTGKLTGMERAFISRAWVLVVFFEAHPLTYCGGVDLYGLSRPGDYGSTERMRSIAGEMEAGLDDLASSINLNSATSPASAIARLDGHGSYVSIVGVWMRTVLDAQHALPVAIAGIHGLRVADVWFAPHIVILAPHSTTRREQRFCNIWCIVRSPMNAQRPRGSAKM